MRWIANGETHVEAFKSLLLEMPLIHSPQDLLKMLVSRLASHPDIALARVFLLKARDVCKADCPMRRQFPDFPFCLAFAASAGTCLSSKGKKWNESGPCFQKFPKGLRIIGSVVSTKQPQYVEHRVIDTDWFLDKKWVEEEKITSFGAQPILYRGEILGGIVVLLRTRYKKDEFTWLRLVADHLASAIVNARSFEEIERLRSLLQAENYYLRAEVNDARNIGNLVGTSSPFLGMMRQIGLVAPTDAGVLILGESGTGKELVAREIHRLSRRSDKAIIKVNCAAIPRELYESEFFGHARGAFTGAVSDRAGRFEAAHRGTLFLDEVGEIPLEMQSKLLRVLQEGQFERVGEEKTRSVDVRIIAATNRDLRREVEEGRFRQDLFYRINVFPILVAPLRKRSEDIPALARIFLERVCRRLHRPMPRLTRADIIELQRYDWPGNVRELENVIERAVITARGDRLNIALPVSRIEQPAKGHGDPAAAPEVLTEEEMKDMYRRNIITALKKTGWKIYGEEGAARLLGVRPTTLSSRMKSLGIEREG